MAARYDLRAKQAGLHVSAADRSWEKKAKSQVTDVGVLPIALLQPILAQVAFKQKMRCEAVCRAWRSVLRSAACQDITTSSSSAGGVWGHLRIHIGKHADRPGVLKASPITIYSYRADDTSLGISEALDPDMRPEADFLGWLQLRAPGADSISITTTSAQEGWLFAGVVLAISGSGRLGVPKTPLALLRGSCNHLRALAFDLHMHRRWLCCGSMQTMCFWPQRLVRCLQGPTVCCSPSGCASCWQHFSHNGVQ